MKSRANKESKCNQEPSRKEDWNLIPSRAEEIIVTKDNFKKIRESLGKEVLSDLKMEKEIAF